MTAPEASHSEFAQLNLKMHDHKCAVGNTWWTTGRLCIGTSDFLFRVVQSHDIFYIVSGGLCNFKFHSTVHHDLPKSMILAIWNITPWTQRTLAFWKLTFVEGHSHSTTHTTIIDKVAREARSVCQRL